MKKLIGLLAVLIFGLVTESALADGCDMCLTPISAVQVGGTANSGGFGTAMFTGDEGVSHALKEGGATNDLKLSVSSDGCTSDCSDMSISFDASAWETVQTLSEAIGKTSGQATTVVNENGVFTGATFGLSRLQQAQ